MKSTYGRHPISEQNAYSLFVWWLAKHDFNLKLAAHLLGVTHRTAQIWVQKKHIPISVAVALEQIQNGPVVQASMSRGLWVVRLEWRANVKVLYEEATKQFRLEGI